MQGGADTFHLVFDVIAGVTMLGGAWLAVSIKLAMAEMRQEQSTNTAELVKLHTELQADLNEKHAENSGMIEKHVAVDEQMFKQISGTLGRFERVLDRLVDQGGRRA